MALELLSVWDVTDADDDVGAVIVTGAGRAFCAGVDLETKPFDREKPAVTPRDNAGRINLRVYDSLKPVIAACNGPAIGVGVTLQLAMDIRLASETARYGLVFARRGITMEGCASWFLPRIVGPATALEWCSTGRVVPASEALARGLVQSVHPPEELLPAAKALAREIVDNSAPVSVALMRQLIWRGLGASHPMEAHIHECRANHHRYGSPDATEGVKAFMEKRPSAFPMTVSEDLPDIWEEWTAPDWRP
jgi:enoyl-CoA hydratase/carnithine racemase